MDIGYLKRVIEGALLAAGEPLNLNQLNALFPDEEKPGHGLLKEALAALDSELENRAVELTEVGSGYRVQIRSQLMPVISQLWTEKPPRYSRALLETLAIIAYRQPITRGEIEQIRGVSLSANILRTLQERDWIKVVGHRDVPGRPELLGTNKAFLDYFNLKSLDQLPTLAEIKDFDNLEPELELHHPQPPAQRDGSDPADESSKDESHGQQDQQTQQEGADTQDVAEDDSTGGFDRTPDHEPDFEDQEEGLEAIDKRDQVDEPALSEGKSGEQPTAGEKEPSPQ